MPTAQKFNELYNRLQPQLELDHLQTPGSPTTCHMGRGQAFIIRVVPEQGLFQCVCTTEEVGAGSVPRDVERMVQEFLQVLNEARTILRPVLLVSPVFQLRALLYVGNQRSADLLQQLGAEGIDTTRLRQGLLVGFHFIQHPGSADSGDRRVADVRIEPFVRDLNNLWIETTCSDPTAAIPGVGVQIMSSGGATSDQSADSVLNCGKVSEDLLNKVKELMDGGGTSRK